MTEKPGLPLAMMSSTPAPATAPAPRAQYGVSTQPDFAGERDPFEVESGAPDVVLELDPNVGGTAFRGGGPAHMRPLSGPMSAQRPMSVTMAPRPKPKNDVGRSLGQPLAVALVGIGIGVIDQVATQTEGAPVQLGPVRLVWIAGALLVVGVATVLLRLLGPSED